LVNVAYLNTIDNGDERNFSMLIHTSGKTDEHKRDYEAVIKIIQILNSGDGDVFERYIKKIWEIAEKRYSEEVDDIVEYILHNKGKIAPIVMNNKSKDDYEPATNPASPFTIAIGGNIISRGMTFKNLLSMFFTRDPKHKMQQDTYIQRARMFGSRGDILKYFELHIPKKLYEDWHRCFVFHRLSWDAIRSGEAPVWLADKRVVPASEGSMKKSIITLDSGEIAFDLFRYTDRIAEIWSSDLRPFEKLVQLRNEIPQAIPEYLVSFIQKFGDFSKNIFLHEPIDVSARKDMDTENIIRKKGLFGGSEIRENSNFNHHCRIFYNKNNGQARLVYKHLGRISFLKINTE
jgi:hypothetical protein